MVKIAARDLKKEAAWRRRLRQQAGSVQSVRRWCRRHRVTETAFYWWRRELARRDAERGSSAAARPDVGDRAAGLETARAGRRRVALRG